MIDKIFTAVVIDDEKNCIANIQQSLLAFPEIQLIGTATTAKEGQQLLISLQPDLLFLDVELPDKTGLDLMRDVQDRIKWKMHLIFHTAYDKYLLEALRLSAFDFLLKPYSEDEFNGILNRFFKNIAKVETPDVFKTSLATLLPHNRTFMVTTITGFQFLKVENIIVFEYVSSKKVWLVQLSDLKQLQLKRGTTAEDILNYSTSFIQISQNYIINFEYLSFIDDNKCLLIPPHDKINLKISRTYLRSLQEKFEMM